MVLHGPTMLNLAWGLLIAFLFVWVRWRLRVEGLVWLPRFSCSALTLEQYRGGIWFGVCQSETLLRE